MDEPAASRRALLVTYRRMRAATRRVTTAAFATSTRDEIMKATKLLRLITDGHNIILEDNDDTDKLADVTLFEMDTTGKRVYDRFLTEGVDKLTPADRKVAQKMQTAFFSLFCIAERHPVAGLWLEDLLDNDRRIWIVDEGLEASGREGLCMAGRLFDAGDYHAGFGIFIPLSEGMVDAYASLSTMPGMASSGGFLCPYIYANQIHDVAA